MTRFFDCVHYHKCLDHAARLGYASLPCAKCAHYQQGDSVTDELELLRIIHFLQVLFQGDEELDGIFTDNHTK